MLDSLEKKAAAFERQHKSDKELLSIAIVNVGYYFDLKLSTDHIAIAEKLSYTKPGKGTDDSVYDERYPFTCQGEPIGLTESSAKIAKNTSTHVLQMLDWDPTKPGKITQELINVGQNGFRDLELKVRPGYSRMSYDAKANVEKLLKFFKDLVLDTHVVQFPYHLNETSTVVVPLSPNPEQQTIDLRSDEEKNLIRQYK